MKIKGFLPAWASLFSFSVVALGAQYLSLLFPTLAVPLWLWPFLLFSALQSAYYATYYLSKRTPWLLCLIELALWMVPVYFLSGRVMQVFVWNAFGIFACWIMARGYGSQFVFMERVADYLGDQGASTVSWEYESLSSNDSLHVPMTYFWWRLWGCAFFLAILAIVVHNRDVQLDALVTWRLRVLGSMAVASGLALQAGSYLFRLQILWGYAKADVSASLRGVWIRNLGIVLLLGVLLVNLAPVDYWPLTAARMGEIIRRLATREFTISLEPLDSPERLPSAGGPPAMGFPQQAAGPWGVLLALLIALLVGGMALVILVVLGFVLVNLIGGELERLKGLPRLAVQVYAGLRDALRTLMGSLRTLGADLKWKASSKKQTGSQEFSPKTGFARRSAPLPKGVRAMFRRIAKVSARKGLAFHPAQTASEFGQVLHKHLPSAKNSVEGFFSGYQTVRYSKQSLSAAAKEHLLQLGEEIIKEIDGLEKGDKGNGTDVRE
ncbi:MAG: DUF4129 domain-containing protein [Bacillota bacterium]|jgi:hypothetical protein|nr:DUF4129 domain-containing protein [Bacillota bacterium]HHT91187.1 DUF4129 domain-containing protein [Bacillota bacterium]